MVELVLQGSVHRQQGFELPLVHQDDLGLLLILNLQQTLEMRLLTNDQYIQKVYCCAYTYNVK